VLEARRGHAMTYYEAGHLTMLFGGWGTEGGLRRRGPRVYLDLERHDVDARCDDGPEPETRRIDGL
jgi:hypothetical protein